MGLGEKGGRTLSWVLWSFTSEGVNCFVMVGCCGLLGREGVGEYWRSERMVGGGRSQEHVELVEKARVILDGAYSANESRYLVLMNDCIRFLHVLLYWT